jgi:hypothetical protein
VIPSYYCHSCSIARSYLGSIATGSVLATTYQLDKFMKHTSPDPRWDVQSVFASPSTQSYRGYIVNSALSGSVHVGAGGRQTVIWVAGETIGFNYVNGTIAHPENAVKVVLSTDSGRIHAYPQSSTKFEGARCADCHQPVIH